MSLFAKKLGAGKCGVKVNLQPPAHETNSCTKWLLLVISANNKAPEICYKLPVMSIVAMDLNSLDTYGHLIMNNKCLSDEVYFKS